MEKYEQISVVGEGSYGLVMKCRHKETDQIVAVKKFLETEEDATIRKMALREIRMLKRLKHENLVTMIEVFRYRKRFYLVFEFLEGTVLDELEKMPGGLGDERSRERIFQVTRAINYCHSNHIIHRDVKPENVLVSSLGVVKLCDFGFARLVNISGEPCTEYVATRWYRAPELLVGETTYGASVDIWAIGCLFAEMMTGDPLFPGESDIDQLYLIVKLMGKPCGRHQHLMSKNSQLRGIIKSAGGDSSDLFKLFPNWSLYAHEFLQSCMKMDPHERFTSDDLLKCNYFLHDRFPQRFLPALRDKVNSEFNANPLLRRFKTEILMSTDKKDEVVGRNKPMGKNLQETVRWRIAPSEGGTKRKLSYDNNSQISTVEDNCSRNLITLSKTSQRLNVIQQPKLAYNNKSKEKNMKEIELLEKSLETLAKLKSEPLLRPKSVIRHNNEEISPRVTPPQFQSLQPGNFGDFLKSPNVLHPTINNISFMTKANVNKSPNLTRINPKSQFLKKLERNVVVDTFGGNLETSWLNSFSTANFSGNHNVKKKQEIKLRSDVFTLPNLPGVTSGSPNVHLKSKKKSLPDLESTTVTPRILSSTSQNLSPSKNSNS